MLDKMFCPSVLQAVPGKGYSVYAYMNDGSVHLFDMSSLMAEPKGIFKQIADLEVFRNQLTVMNGTVAWDISKTRDSHNCIDIDPCEIYAAPISKDPLE